MDASIPNQPRNYQVTNSQGFSNTLKTHNPYAFNTIYDQMYAPGSMYNPQNIPSKNTEMMAYYGESGNKPLLSNPKIAGYYRGVYRPISLAPLDMNMVYPSPEQKRYEQQFSRSYRRK